MFSPFRKIKNFFMGKKESLYSKSKRIAKKALIKYVKTKMSTARSNKWVGSVSTELGFVNDKKIDSPTLQNITENTTTLKSLNIEYKADIFFEFNDSKYPGDSQFDSIQTFKRGGAECNSLNRIAQVWLHTKGFQAYLVTYVASDPTKNRTTCIYEHNNHYYPFDYGIKGKGFPHPISAITDIAQKYNARVIAHVVQNINWNLVDID